MVDKEKLEVLFTEVKSAIPEREWKYYHIQSVDNFIYHLESFKNERTRERMIVDIGKYLQTVAQKVSEEETRVHDKSKQLFPLIWKIAETYKFEIGFIQKPSYLVTIVLIVPLFFLLRIPLNASTSFMVCGFISVAYSIYGCFKVKAKKVF